MLVGSCEIYMRLVGVRTLKDKRSIIKRLINGVEKKFNVAIAEVGAQDIADRTEIGIAVVSNEYRHIESMIDNIINYMECFGEPEIEIISFEKEIN
jgi:hypothetical protein